MTMPPLLGDRYELDGVVGRGGMAEVYRARDLRLDRVVAIKTLRADLARDQTFQARFRREAQSAASLNNPSIVAVYDTGEDLTSGSSIPFIVMEFVDGRTVRDLLIEGHRLLPERTLEIVSGVLRALEYSHQAGIVHRDIKPGNVMVTRNGDIKVMDFGIARAMSDDQATMTQTAQVIGTAQYLSPEQARGERVDARSDLYSTGCLMYELLTGRPPFTGDSPVAIAYQHVRENPVPPSRIDPSLPPWADSIVLKAMAKSPNDRYQSAAEMQADIQRAASGMQVAAAMPPTRADYYQQRTQQMGPQTMMGVAPTTVTPYQQTGYQTGYQQPYGYGTGGYDGGNGEAPRGGARRWLPWLISGLVVLAAIIVAVILLHGSGGSSAFVPQVNGEPWLQAQAQIKAAGLVPVEQKQASTGTKSGLVISTNPDNGNSVAKGGTVTVYVSTGIANITLPNLQGSQSAAAQTQLKNLGFTNVQEVADATSTAPNGTVDHTSPSPGSYPPGQQITLYVSGGGQTVPNVVNQTAVEAQAILQQDGFNVQTVSTPAPADQMVQPGTVYNQNPGANSVKPKGALIQIFVEPQSTSTSTPTTSPSDTSTPTDGTSPTDTPTTTAPTDTTTPGGGGGGGGGGGAGGGGLSNQATTSGP
ncbi:MAG TPA: Stk1 family PASTA domain-containing Ser/Thr kinase [Trebonia sp.]|jgi:serine/threonine-protein kinase|nr:Stk1 family PASTA domain-containing Ser/Thr kinase [Trebonia sp.]